MRKYKQLTLEEREKLYGLQKEGISLRGIGIKLGRSHSSLSRELVRNKVTGIYLPCKADIKAKKRSLKQRRKAPLKDSAVYLYVRNQIREGWSPEQISGRIGKELQGESIHHETIYRYIYSPLWQLRKEKLWEYLPLARVRRMERSGRRAIRGSRIKGAIPIDNRPKYIQKRVQAGHWETDNVIGKQTDKSALSTTVERKSRYIVITKLPARTAQEKRKAVVEKLQPFPQKLRRSITCDNGSENTLHSKISYELGSKIYFTHPYSSWEKGCNENTNGRLRRFIPKKISIDKIDDKTIQYIENKMNNTPRKCLGYLTPNEVMKKLIENTV